MTLNEIKSKIEELKVKQNQAVEEEEKEELQEMIEDLENTSEMKFDRVSKTLQDYKKSNLANKTVLELIIKLVNKAYEENDPDFMMALEHETVINIIDAFLGTDDDELLEALIVVDFNIFKNYQHCDFASYDEIGFRRLEEEKRNAVFYNDKTKILVRGW